MPELCNAFTVDVEDYYQVSAFDRDIPRSMWGDLESRVVPNTERMLQLLDRRGVRGTFFVLGWVARRFPNLVREIDAAGHEVASHGFWHRLVFRQTPRRFRWDLRESRAVLEDIVGKPVVAYRAPSFSITRQSLWALEILVEEGFQADSSVNPIRHHRGGIPDAQTGIHRIETPSGSLVEFPPAVHPLGIVNLPISGGGYFRLYPLALSVYCLNRVNRAARRPFVFYVHPWEIDPDQPRLRAGSFPSRLRHYVNLGSTLRKIDRLLERFPFAPMGEVLRQAGFPLENKAELSRIAMQSKEA